MLENEKLANLLIKFEEKIDCFFKGCNADSSMANDLKELIQEKLKILEKHK